MLSSFQTKHAQGKRRKWQDDNRRDGSGAWKWRLDTDDPALVAAARDEDARMMTTARSGDAGKKWRRARSGEARWRRSEDLLTNRLAAARARSWRRWRRGTLARQRGRFGLGTFWNEDATSGSREARDQRRDRYVTSGYRLGRAKRRVSRRAVATSVAQASVT